MSEIGKKEKIPQNRVIKLFQDKLKYRYLGQLKKEKTTAILKPKSSQVTVKGIHDKRPDIVLYINGIAIGVLELKRSTVSVTEGIRYGCIDTPEKHYLLCSLIHKFGRKEEAGYDEYIRPDSSTEKRQKIMKEWYRVLIKEQIPPILEKYERKTGIKSNSWAVKHMKTKWGSCNMRTDAYG